MRLKGPVLGQAAVWKAGGQLRAGMSSVDGLSAEPRSEPGRFNKWAE
jgi:hypothetical protein